MTGFYLDQHGDLTGVNVAYLVKLCDVYALPLPKRCKTQRLFARASDTASFRLFEVNDIGLQQV